MNDRWRAVARGCGICASLLMQGGCAIVTTKSVPPSELPRVLDDYASHGGSGPRGEYLSEVTVVAASPPANRGGDELHAPIFAKLDGASNLQVIDPSGLKTYPLKDVRKVRVGVEEKRAELGLGIALAVIGGGAMLGGIIRLAIPSRSQGWDAGFPESAIGIVPLGLGALVLLPGVIITARGADRPRYPANPLATIHAGPTGVVGTF